MGLSDKAKGNLRDLGKVAAGGAVFSLLVTAFAVANLPIEAPPAQSPPGLTSAALAELSKELAAKKMSVNPAITDALMMGAFNLSGRLLDEEAWDYFSELEAGDFIPRLDDGAVAPDTEPLPQPKLRLDPVL